MPGAPRKRQMREEKPEGTLPQKKYYRQRAHANPFSDHDLVYPTSPAHMDWSTHYPAFVAPQQPDPDPASAPRSRQPPAMSAQVQIADVGCGFGGLLFALAGRVPADTLLLGLEIRASVTEYVAEKIKAVRLTAGAAANPSLPASAPPANPDSDSIAHPDLAEPPASVPAGRYQNISVLRSNAMKHLPNLFARHSLAAVFLCFPDPHFKARKHKARIVSAALCAEYAYVLAPGRGRVYTITDVEDLHAWMVRHFAAHPLFARVDDAALAGDAWVAAMRDETEEGKKVARNGGRKFVAVFERGLDPPWAEQEGEA